MKNSITFQKQKFKPMTQLNNEIYAVKVPEGATNIEVCNYGLDDALEYDHKGTHAVDDLPPGSYTFLFCTSEVTEEQAASVVQIISNGRISGRPQYRRYDRDLVKDTPAKCWTRDPRHSLETLLASKGCEGNMAVVRRK